MKQHTAQELEGHRIRIESPVKIPVPLGRAVTITDLETGEEVRNVSVIRLHIVPSEVITAQVTLAHIDLERDQDGNFEVRASEERFIVNNPEVALTAIVTQG